MQTWATFCVGFTNVNSGSTMLSLITIVPPTSNNKTLFLQLSTWDDELLSIPKVRFLAVSLSKLHESALSNVIH